jgi:hypothetical protein
MSLHERLDALLSAPRLRLYPRAILAGLIAGCALAVAGGEGARALSGRLGGDFPAFYSAACIAATGRWHSLYDFQEQAAMQAPLFAAAHRPQMLPFVYPPYVAWLYSPLGLLSYRAAYVVHTLLMAAALWLCVSWLHELAPAVSRYRVEAYAAALSFAPCFLALIGGQPAPLLLCALVAAVRADQRGQQWRAGLWLGVLFLKPQYAVAWVLLFALGRRFRVALGALLVFALLYTVAAVALGPDWPLPYARVLLQFQRLDQVHNAAHSIGLLGVADALFGAGAPLALVIALPLMAVCAVYLVRLWTNHPRRSPAVLLAVSAPLVLLLQPHAMQYDAALLVPSLIVLADRGRRRALPALGAVYLAAIATPLADRIGVSPAFGVVLATLWLTHKELIGAATPQAPVDSSAR